MNIQKIFQLSSKRNLIIKLFPLIIRFLIQIKIKNKIAKNKKKAYDHLLRKSFSF